MSNDLNEDNASNTSLEHSGDSSWHKKPWEVARHDEQYGNSGKNDSM
jgi:hypothetical protein